jgi:hypothetical protein
LAGVVAIAASVLVLTGCSAGQPPEFDREQTAQDLPPNPPEPNEWSVDPDSSRYAGEAEGYDLYLGRPAEMGGICVTIVEASTEQWESTACSQGDGVGTELPSGTGVEVGNFRYADATDRTELSESVAIVTTKND